MAVMLRLSNILMILLQNPNGSGTSSEMNVSLPLAFRSNDMALVELVSMREMNLPAWILLAF